jgi:hypothetical protein
MEKENYDVDVLSHAWPVGEIINIAREELDGRFIAGKGFKLTSEGKTLRTGVMFLLALSPR